MKNKEWKFTGHNYVLWGKDFYISFNPGMPFISAFAGDTEEGETALCKSGNFKILNGDFREQYEALIEKGYSACLEFFEANKAGKKSSWSN